MSLKSQVCNQEQFDIIAHMHLTFCFGVLVVSICLAPGMPRTDSDEWPRISKLYLQATTTGNSEMFKKAIASVTQDNSKRAVDLLLKSLGSVGTAKYWAIIAGIGQITSDEGLDAITSEVLTGKTPEIRRDLIMSLRLCQSPKTIDSLHKLLINGQVDIQVSAIDELVDKGDMTCVPILLDIAEKDASAEREMTWRIFRALRALFTEKPPSNPREWRDWCKGRTEGPKIDPTTPNPLPGTASKTVTESLRRMRATAYEDLKNGQKKDILVVEGVSDRVEDVLYRLAIPHTILNWEQLQRTSDLSLSNYTAIFVNCGTADWPQPQAQAIKQFVSQGGYLFATDIAVLQLVRRAFPGYYDAGKGTHGDQKVTIFPARGSTGNPLLRGVDIPIGVEQNQQVVNPLEWTIDAGGPTFSFDSKRVVTLVDAPDLSAKKKPSAVAVTFCYGAEDKQILQGVQVGGVYEDFPQMSGGRVLCVLSHFAKQRQGEDGFALQNLLINFLTEARDRKLLREDLENRKKKR